VPFTQLVRGGGATTRMLFTSGIPHISARCGNFPGVRHTRRCSRTACDRSAVATLTYVYADSTAVLGPLAIYPEPHCYDLCAEHSERLTVPRGWEVMRLALDTGSATSNSDDLEALANAVREAACPPLEPARVVPAGRRGHLRVLHSSEE